MVAFERAERVDDGGGGTSGGFVEVFRAAAEIKYQRGGETVIGQRLQGVQPSVVAVLDFAASRSVTTAWRIRDPRSGELFNIRAVTPKDDRSSIDFLCDSGRADGGETYRA